MYRNLFAAVALFFCLVAGSSALQAQTTPIELNDKLVAITDSLYARGQSWGRQFNAAVADKNFTKLSASRIQLDAFLDRKIAEVKSMKDVKDSKGLRDAILAFLQFEKSMISKAFMPVEKLGVNPTQAQIEAALENLKLQTRNEGTELQKVNVAQEAYARANGFMIEQPAAADGN